MMTSSSHKSALLPTLLPFFPLLLFLFPAQVIGNSLRLQGSISPSTSRLHRAAPPTLKGLSQSFSGGRSCPPGWYLDKIVNSCESCVDICDPARGTQADCQEHIHACNETLQQLLSTFLSPRSLITEIANTTPTITGLLSGASTKPSLGGEEGNSYSVLGIAGFAIIASVLSVAMVLTVISLYRSSKLSGFVVGIRNMFKQLKPSDDNGSVEIPNHDYTPPFDSPPVEETGEPGSGTMLLPSKGQERELNSTIFASLV